MKKLILLSIFLMGVMFFGCTQKDNGYYDRANKASEKSLIGLEKDTSL